MRRSLGRPLSHSTDERVTRESTLSGGWKERAVRTNRLVDSRTMRFVPSAMGVDPATARFGSIRAGYESYYLRVTAPEGGRGFWVRYTVRIAPGQEPIGSLWFTWFDGAGPVATKLTSPAIEGDGPCKRPWLTIAGAVIGAGHAAGAIGPALRRRSAQWDLDFSGDALLAHLDRGWMYAAPLPRTKPVSLHPMARFTGTVTVDGTEHGVDRWPGMVGHNWGSQHAQRWIWLHGMAFDSLGDDSWIDVVLGRIKLGPVLLPWVASGAISIEGQRLALGGLGRTRAVDVRERPTGARLTLPGPRGTSVRVNVGAERARFVGWTYCDPDGHSHEVANCSIADIAVTLRRPKQADLTLRASGTAAYELGMQEQNHGIPIQPFPDGPALPVRP